MRKSLALSLSLLALLAACKTVDFTPPPLTPPTPASPAPDLKTLDSAWAAEWMDLSTKLVQMTGASPPVASRVYAYSAVALNESLASVDKEMKTLQGRVNGLNNLPKPAGGQALDGRWVAHAALKTFVPTLFHVTLSDEQTAEITALEQQFDKQLSVPQAVKDASLAYGRQLGAALIAWCQQDQFKQLRAQTYALPDAAGHPDYWVPTVTGAKPLEPNWGKLRTFAIADGTTCHKAPSVGFSTAAESDFYGQAKEVLDTTKNLSEEQTTIARWWADNPGQTTTPPGHWIRIAGQQVRERKLDIRTSTRLYALLGIAMADSFVSCWASKYQVNLLRPMTYIRNVIGEKDWIPLLATPMFPEYPSGHSVSSGAAAEIFTSVLGEHVGFTDTTHVHRGMEARRFADFRTAAQEAAVSRLYGGIHFRDAIENGLSQGQCISSQVLGKLGG
ncbi:MAG: vanadium-dependent haloperoxidase [Candidatus Sericytochromatia bacterium]